MDLFQTEEDFLEYFDELMSKHRTLMGHEINRARLRILTPIGEDTSLSPVPPSPRSRRDRDDDDLRYPRDHQLVLISDQLEGFEPVPDDLIPAVPSPRPLYDQRSKELDSLVDGYLTRTLPLKRHRKHDVAFCECCENVNTVNREKRKQYWGKLPQDSEHDADPAKTGLNYLADYGLLSRTDELGEVPVHEGRYQMLYPTLAARAGVKDDNDRGSATLMYPYLPRGYAGYPRHVNFDGYYNEWGRLHGVSNPPYERHLSEDVMQAASNYDNSMMRLKGTVGLFQDEPKYGSFT